MKESLEDLKAIIDGKPEGANYIAGGYYLMVEGLHCKVFNTLGVWSVPVCNAADIFIDGKPRSLSDIEEIIELREWKIEANKNYQSMFDVYLND